MGYLLLHLLLKLFTQTPHHSESTVNFRMRFLLVLLLLALTANTSSGQDMLMFIKNKNKIVYYKMGDIISFQLKSDKQKITAQIRGFTDNSIVFQYYTIDPNEISHMYVDNKTKQWYFMRFKYEKFFLIGGAGYLLLDLANTGELTKETLVVSGSLFTAGLLAKFLISKKIKIKGRRMLRVLNL